MKKYIIFTPEITNMGGAQMYTANKVQFLKSNGWDVHVFFPKKKGEIKIPVLQDYKNNLIPELGIGYIFIGSKLKNKLFQRVESVCKGADEIVLESQIITQSFIVEEIAQLLCARHIINTLDERIPVSFKGQNRFFEYKLRRWEFQNAAERRLRQIFKGDYKDDFLCFENIMVYKCSNVVIDDDKRFQFAQADYNILSIGRLDKPYILPMTEEIRSFATKYKEKVFNIIFVGGSFSGIEENKVNEILQPIENINLYMLGYCFPISKSILELADVAIACANSVRVSADQDIPTIVADIDDCQAIGVFGYNTENMFYRQTEQVVPINKYLEDVLINSLYPRKKTTFNYMDDMNEAFECEMKFIEKSKSNTGYFNIKSLVTLKTRIISRLLWWKYQILNPEQLYPRKHLK